MLQQDTPVPSIVAEAEELIRKIQQDFDAAAEFYRSNDIDPAKVEGACEPFMGERERQELRQIVENDQAEIQREVDEGAARLRFSNSSTSSKPVSGGARRPRNMI